MLAAPALLAAWLARPPEHRLVAGVLWRPRRAIAMTSAVLFVAAATLALGTESGPYCLLWSGLTAVQTWIVFDVIDVRAIVGGSPYAQGSEEGETNGEAPEAT